MFRANLEIQGDANFKLFLRLRVGNVAGFNPS